MRSDLPPGFNGVLRPKTLIGTDNHPHGLYILFSTARVRKYPGLEHATFTIYDGWYVQGLEVIR